jgi:hypothetical protein
MSFFKKALLVASGQVALVAVNVAGTMILARSLRGDMGRYDLFRNLGILAITVMSLGIGNANIYVLNSELVPLARVASNTLIALLVVGSGVATGLSLVVLHFTRFFGQVSAPVAMAFGIGSAALLGTLLLRSLLVARLAVRQMVLVDLVAPLLILCGKYGCISSLNCLPSTTPEICQRP